VRMMLFGLSIGLLVGVVVGGLVVAGPLGRLLTTSGSGDTGLLGRFQGAYRQSLVSPLTRAEHEIEDRDIAEFYHQLLEDCGLAR